MWTLFTFAVGPSGRFLAELAPDQQDRVRDACRAALPEGPFTLTARAWFARATAAWAPSVAPRRG